MTILPKSALAVSVAALMVLSACGTDLALSGSRAAPSPTAQQVAAVSPTGTTGATTPAPSDTPTPAPADAAHSGAVHPCDLLTPQELAPLLGPGVNGLDTSSGTISACAFTGAGVTTIVVDPTVGTTGFDSDCSTNNPAPSIQTVSGIGDGACLSIVGGSIAVVYVMKGADVMSINVQAGGATPVTSEQLIAVARSATNRL